MQDIHGNVLLILHCVFPLSIQSKNRTVYINCRRLWDSNVSTSVNTVYTVRVERNFTIIVYHISYSTVQVESNFTLHDINMDLDPLTEDFSLSQIDRQLYLEVKRKAGSYDKDRFCKTLDKLYKNNIDELNHVRKGLFEEARRCVVNLQYGTLVKRTNSEKSTATEKLLEDIYVIYRIIDGGYAPTEIKQVLSYKDRQHSMNDIEFNNTGDNLDDEESEYCESESYRHDDNDTLPEPTMSNIAEILICMRSDLMEKIHNITEINKEQSMKIEHLSMALEKNECKHCTDENRQL